MARETSSLPDFMRADAERVNAGISKEFVVPPRLRQVQPTAKAPVSDIFSKGDVCMMPGLMEVAKVGKPFLVVPLYFFAEWLETNPVEAPVFIRARTLDPKHEIAVKARNPLTRRIPWDEEHGGSDPTKFISYQETLNFIVAVVGHPELTGMVASMGFARAEHKTGTSWATQIKMRGIPMCGTVWEMSTAKRTNTKGEWYGFNSRQCSEDQGMVLDPGAYAQFVKLHDDFMELHREGRVMVQTDQDELLDSGPKDKSTGEF
jgi:hypothetical protein